ncbi:MAG TPA: ribonuclease P protein subunit [Candidatus Nanoarchaeia archaeon]|nr:ribonuclease P protein subunit [Candidatus Nanoarchaeia archaeon]
MIAKNIIGAQVHVSEAKNKTNIGIEGTIIDETRQTLKIMTKEGTKTIIKKNVTLEFPEERLRVKGALFIGRPEERLKKK